METIIYWPNDYHLNWWGFVVVVVIVYCSPKIFHSLCCCCDCISQMQKLGVKVKLSSHKNGLSEKAGMFYIDINISVKYHVNFFTNPSLANDVQILVMF